MLSPPMLLIASRHFLAVGAHADDDEQRDRGRFAVEPDAHHGAVENEPHDRFIGQRAGIPRIPVALHLAPDPAHRVLANGAAEKGTQGAAYAAGVGAGEVAAGDQRVGGQRAALVGSQRLALPLRCLAVGGVQPRARHPRSPSARMFPAVSASGARGGDP